MPQRDLHRSIFGEGDKSHTGFVVERAREGLNEIQEIDLKSDEVSLVVVMICTRLPYVDWSKESLLSAKRMISLAVEVGQYGRTPVQESIDRAELRSRRNKAKIILIIQGFCT